MLASQNGHTETVGKLIAAGAELDLQSRRGFLQNVDGFSALMLASQNGHTQTVGKRIAAGAELNLQSTGDFSALMWASESGNTEAAGKLIAAGAKLDLQGGLLMLVMLAAAYGRSATTT